MKKLYFLTSILISVFVGAQQTQTLVQFSNPDVFNEDAPVCQSEEFGGSLVNHNGRVYDLSYYGINSPFKLTKVDVLGTGTENASIKARLAKVNGNPSVPGNLEVLDMFGEYLYEDTFSDTWVEIDMSNTYTFEGGSKFAVVIEHKYVTGGTWFLIGNNNTNANPENSPSYIGFPGSQCVNNQAMIPVTDAGFPVSWLFSITGEVEGMGTVELGSKSLSVYPNPVTDVINISMKNGDAQSVEIVNLVGQSVYSAKAANSVNVSFLPAGVYVVKVKDTKGVTHINKIVKK